MKEKLLVLDIDETLLHATPVVLSREPDYRTSRLNIYKRPHVDEFLAFCGRHFRVAVWTTARQSFAEEMFSRVFSPDYALEFIRSESHCTRVPVSARNKLGLLKDLDTLDPEKYPLDRTLMVDDSPEKLAHHPGNLIPVAGFYGDEGDCELKKLMRYLEFLMQQPQISTIDKGRWRHSAFACNTGVGSL